MADNMLIDGLIKFCDEKSKNIKLKAEPQVFVEIRDALLQLKVLKSDGFTDDLLNMGYTKGYNKAIDEFAEALKERLKGMQMVELQGEDVCPCAETGEECPYINQDIGCQYCAREHTIQEVDEIAEQLKGEQL